MFELNDKVAIVTGGNGGLGLAIAASAIRRHGGHIEAGNAPEGGLKVVVELPMQQAPSGA